MHGGCELIKLATEVRLLLLARLLVEHTGHVVESDVLVRALEGLREGWG